MDAEEPVQFWIGALHCKECNSSYQWYRRTSDILNISEHWQMIHKRQKKGPKCREEIRWWISPHHCKACQAEYDWNKNHNDIFQIGRGFHKEPNYEENHERRRLSARMTALRAYGGPVPECACCEETEIDFLCIDHINNDGGEHRREIGRGSLYRWLKRHNYPPGFQVLCYNCNEARRYGRQCPHQRSA